MRNPKISNYKVNNNNNNNLTTSCIQGLYKVKNLLNTYILQLQVGKNDNTMTTAADKYCNIQGGLLKTAALSAISLTAYR